MAALPPNSTARFKIFYHNAIANHVMQVRWGGSPSALSAAMGGILVGLGSLVASSTIDIVEFAASGSNVFNTVVSGLEALSFGTGTGTIIIDAQYINFIGRSTGGRRVRLAVFGAVNEGGNFRFTSGEESEIDGAIAVLNDPGQPFQCIDGLHPIWKVYANSGQNAHWQKAHR